MADKLYTRSTTPLISAAASAFLLILLLIPARQAAAQTGLRMPPVRFPGTSLQAASPELYSIVYPFGRRLPAYPSVRLGYDDSTARRAAKIRACFHGLITTVVTTMFTSGGINVFHY